MELKNTYCLYYTARVERSLCWFLAAVVRGSEHVCFDRAVDKYESIFEFFVPQDNQKIFCEIMEYLKTEKVVLEYHQGENRLITEEF